MRTEFPTEAPPELALSDEQVAELMADDMLPEYEIDYSKAQPNRFAARTAETDTAE